MRDIRVALIQLAWTGERSTMKAAYRRMIAEAVRQGTSLICLPEFSLSPYFPGKRDPAGFQWAEPLRGGESDQFFTELAANQQVSIISSIYERGADGRYYDTAVIHGPDGVVLGFTRKVHIPSGEGYHETDYFIGGEDYPIHDVSGVKIAAPTCYDQWFPEMARICAVRGAEYIFYPTAIGAEPTDPDMDSAPMWQMVMRGHAIANGVFVGAANRIGQENGIPFYGSSFICDPMGNVLAQAGRDTTEILVADLKASVLERWRGLFPLLYQRKPGIYGDLLKPYTGGGRPDWLPDEN